MPSGRTDCLCQRKTGNDLFVKERSRAKNAGEDIRADTREYTRGNVAQERKQADSSRQIEAGKQKTERWPQGGGIWKMEERLKRQLDFALEIDKEKNIFRQTHLSGHGRRENDAEHAWHMAVMAYLLREYSNEEVDIGRVMIMCLIHDIVEIESGDTYAYDEENLKTQKQREETAKEKIYSLLPEDQKQEMIALFDEFEESKTAEAKFAHAMDNLQPLILNNSNNGGDWKEHGICAKQVYGRHEKTKEGSGRLYQAADEIIQENIRKGNLI